MLNCKCNLCGSANCSYALTAKIMKSLKSDLYKCTDCGLLFFKNPYWLNEVYKDPVSLFDTGQLSRNISVSHNLSVLEWLLFGYKHAYVDYAGGNGLLVRLMRDTGFDYYWDDKFSNNIFSRGFEWESSKRPIAVSAIECFEHFPDPMTSIDSIFNMSENVFFTTELLPESVPNKKWWYYAFDRGGHVSFYEKRTFEYLAKKYNVNYYYYYGLHIFVKNKISIFKRLLLSVPYSEKLIYYVFIRYMQRKKSKVFSDYNYLCGLKEDSFGRKN
jgi:hypothetical protein